MKVKYLAHKLEEKIIGGKLIRERIDYKFNGNELFIIMERFYSKIESYLLGKNPLKTEVICEHFSFKGLEDGTWNMASLDTSFYLQPILDVFIKDGVLHITLLQDQPGQELDVWIEPDFDSSVNKIKYKKATFEWINREGLLEEIKGLKKSELSQRCQEDILNGFTFEIEDQIYHLNYDKEAQANLQERWQLFQNNIIESIKLSAYLNNAPIRLEVDKEKFSYIYMESVRAKEAKISKLKDELYPIIDNCKTQTELDSITWEMDTIDPVPSPLKLDDDHTLEKRIEDVRVNSAKSTNEILSLVMMNMGMGGLF